MNMTEEQFISWAETHFEVVAYLTECRNQHDNAFANFVNDSGGTGLFYELAKDWTDEFERNHQNTVWGEDLDWCDTIEEFCDLKARDYLDNN